MDLNPNRILLLTLLFVGLLAPVARSQDYPLRSLTGERARLHVSFDTLHETLSVRCATDTLRVRNVLNLIETHVLSEAFLLIAYRVHAGVGLHSTRTLLLSARDHRVHTSLSFTSGFAEDFMDFSQHRPAPKRIDVKTRYAVDLSVHGQVGATAPAFHLIATVRGKTRSRLEPVRNAQYERRVALTFDPRQQIFYGRQEYISHRFQVFDPKAESETMQELVGTFPVLTLGEYKYVYWKDTWYELNQHADLTKYTY